MSFAEYNDMKLWKMDWNILDTLEQTWIYLIKGQSRDEISVDFHLRSMASPNSEQSIRLSYIITDCDGPFIEQKQFKSLDSPKFSQKRPILRVYCIANTVGYRVDGSILVHTKEQKCIQRHNGA